MYILSFGVWFIKLVRQFFFLIDSVVFNFITTVYNLLIDIARTSVLSQADIADMTKRIYQLLAVFMIFRVIFSLIMYVVNPDDFSDKSKGISKLGTNVVISLALLVLTPYLFSYAYNLQTIILEDDSLGTLIFGTGDDKKDDYSMFSGAGDKIAFNALVPFFTPNTTIDELSNCVTITEQNGEFNMNCSGIDLSEDEVYTGDEETLAGLAETKEGSKLKYSPNYTKDDVANYVAGMETGKIGLMFRQNMVLARVKTDNDEEFIMDYKFIFSTAVGVVIIFLLISFCMDVALRSIKLSFLQLIAPIPILSYIDPKSGKDGLFKKWYQLCFKTFTSLFVRLLSLYFGVFIIGKINNISDVINGSYQSNLFVKIFVIIGVLMFIKQLPKILEGLGIKLDGDGKFTLNPIKKFQEEAFGGKQIIGAGAAGLAGAAAMGTNALVAGQKIKNAKGFWGKVGAAATGIGGMAAGGFSAMSRGLMGAAKGEKFGKNFSNSYGTAMANRQKRADRVDDGVGWGEMMKSKVEQKMGLHSTQDAINSAEAHIKKINEAYSTMQSQAEAMDKKNFSVSGLRGTYTGPNAKIAALNAMSFNGIKDLKKFQEQAQSEKIEQRSGETEAAFIKRQRDHQEYLREIDDTISSRMASLASGAKSTGDAATDRAIRDSYRIMQEERDAFNNTIDSIDPNVGHISGTAPKDISGSSKGAGARLSVSEVRQHADKVQQYGAKKDSK